MSQGIDHHKENAFESLSNAVRRFKVYRNPENKKFLQTMNEYQLQSNKFAYSFSGITLLLVAAPNSQPHLIIPNSDFRPLISNKL